MEERTCFDCVYCVWDKALWLRTFAFGFPARAMCTNHPDTPGKLREVPLDGPCRNFRKKRRPPAKDGWVPPAVPVPTTQQDEEGIRRIPLTQGLFATVDAADYEELSQYKWFALYTRSNVYAARFEKRRIILMHRQIMKAPKGMVVDHINHDGVNNRQSNLRVCTPEENWANKKPRGGSSRFIGVHRDKGKWKAGVTRGGVYFCAGWFEDEVEAARARDRKAVEVWGKFANLNFPEEWVLGEDGIYRPRIAG